MPDSKPPRVLLFDIGGVCVVSPFQAILDYELARSIPAGYVNYSISKTSPNGFWHKLERGDIPCDAAYFRGFKSDLENPTRWREFYRQHISKTKGEGAARALSESAIPTVPDIDAETLFWTMMGQARFPDPYMYPALKKLKADGRFRLAALSNTVIFPEGHAFNNIGADDVRGMFEVFVSSAHVGMRKPDRKIYEYTMEKLREAFGEDLQEGDVVFTDDIGENLKTAKALGMRTIRVFLGKTSDAVRELEKVTGLKLLEEGSRGGAKL